MAKKITEESLAENPEWIESGLKVGDDVPKKANMVEVDIDMLKDLMKEVEGMRGVAEEVARLKKDNDMLLAVADKGRIQNWQNKNSPMGLIREARAWVLDGKLVKATYTVRNSAFTDSIGRIHTDQVLNVMLEDGEEKEMSYDQFMKERTLIEGDIISRATDEVSGQTFLKLKFKDGKEFTVNITFTN